MLAPPCIMSLKVPSLVVCYLFAVPKTAFYVVLFFEIFCWPKPLRVSYVWCLSNFLTSPSRRPALGSVHLGTFDLVEGFAACSGAYRAGPTEAGVDVWFIRPPVGRLYPKV